jgi:hypothetical protein
MPKKGGWFKQPARHALAARGISSMWAKRKAQIYEHDDELRRKKRAEGRARRLIVKEESAEYEKERHLEFEQRNAIEKAARERAAAMHPENDQLLKNLESEVDKFIKQNRKSFVELQKVDADMESLEYDEGKLRTSEAKEELKAEWERIHNIRSKTWAAVEKKLNEVERTMKQKYGPGFGDTKGGTRLENSSDRIRNLIWQGRLRG